MRLRQLLIAIFTLTITLNTASAQPREKHIQAEPPPLEKVVRTTAQPDVMLSDVIAAKPEMPLSPLDVLKAYEMAMNLVVEKASTDFSAIAQAQQANQISREQAEYLLQETYQVAMMQFQMLSALHDVLKYDIDQTTEQTKRSLRNANAETVLVVPVPASSFGSK